MVKINQKIIKKLTREVVQINQRDNKRLTREVVQMTIIVLVMYLIASVSHQVHWSRWARADCTPSNHGGNCLSNSGYGYKKEGLTLSSAYGIINI